MQAKIPGKPGIITIFYSLLPTAKAFYKEIFTTILLKGKAGYRLPKTGPGERYLHPETIETYGRIKSKNNYGYNNGSSLLWRTYPNGSNGIKYNIP